MNDSVRLGDESIAMIAKLVQMAILTGTDVVDNLRTLRLHVEDNVVNPHPDFLTEFDESIAKMTEEVANIVTN